ncbi:hypothetical protein ACTFIR_011047 [Dictyostelium discoideum]
METKNEISTILDLFPNLTIRQATDCLKTCNNNIEQTINYLVENIDIVTSVTTKVGSGNIKSTDDIINNSTTTTTTTTIFKTEEDIENERLFKEFMENELKQSEIQNSSKTHLCMVCYCELPITDFYILDECNHKYCNHCLNTHYTMQVRSGYSDLKCPMPTCRYKPTYEEVQHILSKDYFEKYDKILVNVHLNKDKNIRYCPEIDCGAAIIMPSDNSSSTTQSVECSNQECKSSYCLNCREPSHSGLTCEQYETAKLELAELMEIEENQMSFKQRLVELFSQGDANSIIYDKAPPKRVRNRLFFLAKKWGRYVNTDRIHELQVSASTLKWVLENTKICPTCKIIIEKIDGCNSMDCICGTNFCFGCGVKRSEHSAIRFPCYGPYYYDS